MDAYDIGTLRPAAKVKCEGCDSVGVYGCSQFAAFVDGFDKSDGCRGSEVDARGGGVGSESYVDCVCGSDFGGLVEIDVDRVAPRTPLVAGETASCANVGYVVAVGVDGERCSDGVVESVEGAVVGGGTDGTEADLPVMVVDAACPS